MDRIINGKSYEEGDLASCQNPTCQNDIEAEFETADMVKINGVFCCPDCTKFFEESENEND